MGESLGGEAGKFVAYGWKVRAIWDLEMSCWAARKVAMVRDHLSVVAPVTLGASSRGQQPHSWLRGSRLQGDLSMVSCSPGRAFKVENLNKLFLGGRVSSRSPHSFCVVLSLERLDPCGEEHGHWHQTPGFESQLYHLVAVQAWARIWMSAFQSLHL